MASPTEAEIQAQIKALVDIYEEVRKFGHVNATNLLAKIQSYEDILEGDFLPEAEQGIGSLRDFYSGSMLTFAQAVTPQLRSYGRLLKFPETDPTAILARLYQYFIANSLSVNSRAITFGTPTFSGAVGDGVINRLSKDENNLDIEAVWVDDKVAECIGDQAAGARRHEEVFEVHGGALERDNIRLVGSGAKAEVKALCGRDTERYLGNPSFDVFEGTTTVPAAITDWEVAGGTLATTIQLTTTMYRDYPGSAETAHSLNLLGNSLLRQKLSRRNAQFDPNVPVYVQMAVQRKSSITGNLTLRFGAVSVTQALGSLSNDQWAIVRIAIGQNNWHKQFNQDDPDVEIELASYGGSGNVFIDDIVIAPYVPIGDGTWYAIVGGATPFKRRDKATWADSETGAKIQHWLFRSFGRYLPHNNAGGETWTDP